MYVEHLYNNLFLVWYILYTNFVIRKKKHICLAVKYLSMYVLCIILACWLGQKHMLSFNCHLTKILCSLRWQRVTPVIRWPDNLEWTVSFWLRCHRNEVPQEVRANPELHSQSTGLQNLQRTEHQVAHQGKLLLVNICYRSPQHYICSIWTICSILSFCRSGSSNTSSASKTGSAKSSPFARLKKILMLENKPSSKKGGLKDFLSSLWRPQDRWKWKTLTHFERSYWSSWRGRLSLLHMYYNAT